MSQAVAKFVWYELTTTDLDAAQAFYEKVVGWSIADSGMPGMRYSAISAPSGMVGGMMAINDEMRARGVPPCWTGYVAVSNVDDYAQRVTAAGGQVHMAPQDIPGVGRFAVVADPFGAVFMLFTPNSDQQPTATGMEPGRTGWHELHAGDREAAFAFYAGLFGWTKTAAHDMGPMGLYQMFATGADAVGGMMTKSADMPQSCWLFYFNVDSAKAAGERAVAAGGKLLNGPMEVPGGAWIVQCQDPQGAMFAMVGGA